MYLKKRTGNIFSYFGELGNRPNRRERGFRGNKSDFRAVQPDFIGRKSIESKSLDHPDHGVNALMNPPGVACQSLPDCDGRSLFT